MSSELGPEFEFEFHAEGDTAADELRPVAERRLRDLAEGHNDMTGAAVSVEELAEANTPFIFRARVVAYIRPNNLVATEKADTDMGALKGALDALERQVWKQRDKLGKPWERPSAPQPLD